MKKILAFVFTVIISLTIIPFSSACVNVNDNGIPTFLPFKTYDKISCRDAVIDCCLTSYLITPAGFDFEKLNNYGYRMTITVTYDVYYIKNWNVLWDIGYLGAPKYEATILDDDLIGEMQANIIAPSKTTTRIISYTTDVVNLIGTKICLTFSSDNIQNIIYFENIKVVYNCHM